jgi:hypothetical protein
MEGQNVANCLSEQLQPSFKASNAAVLLWFFGAAHADWNSMHTQKEQ